MQKDQILGSPNESGIRTLPDPKSVKQLTEQTNKSICRSLSAGQRRLSSWLADILHHQQNHHHHHLYHHYIHYIHPCIHASDKMRQNKNLIIKYSIKHELLDNISNRSRWYRSSYFGIFQSNQTKKSLKVPKCDPLLGALRVPTSSFGPFLS